MHHLHQSLYLFLEIVVSSLQRSLPCGVGMAGPFKIVLWNSLA
jgi:hypothetical protein